MKTRTTQLYLEATRETEELSIFKRIQSRVTNNANLDVCGDYYSIVNDLLHIKIICCHS